jgi:phage gp36-like protein
MSAYCSQNDLLGDIQMADLITLTDDDSPATGVLNSTVLNAVISKASGVIDRMVGNVYDIPFNPIPASVNSLAIAIACYTLYRRREVPDEKNKFAEDYRLAMQMLVAVNKREQFLDLSAGQDFDMVAPVTTPTVFGSGNYPASSR